MKPVITGTITALALVAALAGCRSAGSAGSSASAAARAAATSTAVATAKADARAYFAPCWPASAAAQIQLITSLGTSAGREALMGCAGVPKADRSAAAACTLTNIEHGGKLPKGTEAKLTALLGDAYPCARKYRAGGAS